MPKITDSELAKLMATALFDAYEKNGVATGHLDLNTLHGEALVLIAAMRVYERHKDFQMVSDMDIHHRLLYTSALDFFESSKKGNPEGEIFWVDDKDDKIVIVASGDTRISLRSLIGVDDTNGGN